MMRSVAIVAVGVGLALLGGCSHHEQAKVSQEAQNLGARVQQAAQNGALEAKVRMALATRKELKGTDIHVDVNGSAVTLKGDVKTREQAAEAVRVTQATEGVATVKNELALRVPVKGAGGSQ